jgi:hypothetical protein
MEKFFVLCDNSISISISISMKQRPRIQNEWK